MARISTFFSPVTVSAHHISLQNPLHSLLHAIYKTPRRAYCKTETKEINSPNSSVDKHSGISPLSILSFKEQNFFLLFKAKPLTLTHSTTHFF